MKLLDDLHEDICVLQELGLIINDLKSKGITELSIEDYEALLNSVLEVFMKLYGNTESILKELNIKNERIDELLDHLIKK